MRHHHPLPSFAEGVTGEIVTTLVTNPLENSSTRGKARPAILLTRNGCRWLVMGLTTRSSFLNGVQRTPVPNPTSCGLGRGPSFLWGRPTWISALDVGDHIGYASADLLGLVNPFLPHARS